jgi:long-chain fatty acid transport protein
MKKFSLMLTLAIMMVGSAVFAGSLDYLSNQSAKYIMNTARTAATDGADIVAYNPAGTALMGEGLFIDVSSQTLLKYYTAKEDAVLDDEYKQSEPTLVLPNVYAVYNFGQLGMGKLAAFAQAGIVAGGGTIKWDDGTVGSNLFALTKGTGPASIETSLDAISGNTATFNGATTSSEASSVYYSFGGGVSYSFLEDMLSASIGAKYVMARRTGKVDGTLNYTVLAGPAAGTFKIDIVDEYEYEANGITPVFGFDAKPMKELTIGVRFEMETDLEFDYTQKKADASSNNAFVNTNVAPVVAGQLPDYDGLKANQNLPQILSLGAEYVVMPELTVSVASNIYFIGDADMEGLEDSFGTGYEIGFGAIYKVMEPLKVGGTFMYTNQAVKDEYLEDDASLLTTSANPILDSLMFGLGATYTVLPNLDVTLAGNWVHYLPVDVDTAGGLEISYEKEVYTIALGVAYKM